jgi:hypothetical protein
LTLLRENQLHLAEARGGYLLWRGQRPGDGKEYLLYQSAYRSAEW